MIRRSIALGLLCCLLLGCTPFDGLLSQPQLRVPEVLTVEDRSGPMILLRINTTEVGKIECGGEATFGAAVDGLPPLPWVVEVVRLSDAKVLWTETVDQLPRWLLVTIDGVLIGSTQPAGPPGPPCST